MPVQDPIRLYQEQYIDKQFERAGLFELLSNTYPLEACLYPGGFTHCTPSFFFPVTVYIDTDDRATRFFKSSAVRRYIEERRHYPQPPTIRFHHQDYDTDIPEQADSFDLLLSLYAGFVSPACTRYLKPGGLLVANNSHGDASMASLDERLRFLGAVHARGDRYRLVTDDLDRYFHPKKELLISPSYLRKMGRGVAYTKPADYYLFRRVT